MSRFGVGFPGSSVIDDAADLACARRYCCPPGVVSLDHVDAVRRFLTQNGLVLCNKDRNNSRATLTCAALYHHDYLETFSPDSPNYTDVNCSLSRALELLLAQSRPMLLVPLSKPKVAAIPYTYIQYKHKDTCSPESLWSKRRPVTSYVCVPWSWNLNICARILTVIARCVPESSHFTLWRTCDLVSFVVDTNAEIARLPGSPAVVCGDIENMFTMLPLRHCISALSWATEFFLAVSGCDVHDRRFLVDIRRRSAASLAPDSFRPPKSSPLRLFSASQTLALTTWSIENAYFSVGNQTRHQVLGVPQGSPTSPIISIITCMRAEYQFLSSLGADAKYVRAARYIDDVMVVILSSGDLARSARIKSEFLRCYPPPLSLKCDTEPYVRTFLESQVTLGSGGINLRYLCKNTSDVAAGRPLTFCNVMYVRSFVPMSRILQTLYTALFRIPFASSSPELEFQGTVLRCLEFLVSGYSLFHLCYTLSKLHLRTGRCCFLAACTLLRNYFGRS